MDQFSGVFISVDMILPSCSVTTTLAAIFIAMLLFPSSVRPHSDIFPGCTRLYSREEGLYEKKFEMVFSVFNQNAITNILINIKAATIDMIYDDVFDPSHIIIYEEQNSIFCTHTTFPKSRTSGVSQNQTQAYYNNNIRSRPNMM